MLAASAASFEPRATVPHVLGIAFGFTLMLAIVCPGLASVLLAWPSPLPAMRWAGAAWMLLLAWKIAMAPPPSATGGRILGFSSAMAFQSVNPKGSLIALSAAGLFARSDEALRMQGIRVGAVFFAVALPCVAPWVLLGAGGAIAIFARTVRRIQHRDGGSAGRFYPTDSKEPIPYRVQTRAASVPGNLCPPAVAPTLW